VQVGAGLENGKQELERLERQGEFKLGWQRKGTNLKASGGKFGHFMESRN
jgi:hypothetical protein